MSKILFLLAITVIFFTTFTSAQPKITEGTLIASGKKGKTLGEFALKNTSVRTDISGFLARVRVVQEFQNDFAESVEAVYTFPLSQNSAVDDMTMTIGGRIVRGKIMKRVEARAAYEAAKEEGKTAGLLDQERANIFTQSVANIRPGEKVVVEISYVETLKYEDGQYEFVFPMVVGERYIPASVKPGDAARISGFSAQRSGHDISIEVNLNAGVPVEAVRSISHEIENVNLSPNTAKITLKDEKIIPNKDFILRYDVTGKRIEDAVLAHRDERGGFFSLVLQPPDQFVTEDRTPKEIVFVLDTSGSMGGFPIEKAKEAMKLSLDGLYPDDTFNLITFAGATDILFNGPVYATQANLEKARAFLESRRGGGGTEMMKAIKAALEPSDALDHLRIVCFMTDGYVGNEEEIISEIQKHPKARVFSFGIGNSVNRFLLDKMASEGRGEVEYVSLQDDGSAAAKKFYERVRTPLLTDISIDWSGLAVSDVYPQKVPDLFSAKPVILHGRNIKPGGGTIRINVKVAGQHYSREIPVNLPEAEGANDVLAPLWARTQIDGLMSDARKYTDNEDPEQIANQKKVIDAITRLGLDYRLMTQFTSFVAVEDRITPEPGVMAGTGKTRKTKAARPSRAGDTAFTRLETLAVLQRPPAVKKGSGVGYGSGNGSGGSSGASYGASMGNSPANVVGLTVAVPKTISSGVLNGKSIELPTPSYPQAAKAVRASGAVAVQVTIDESGKVISADAVSGHPLLRAAAAAAAKNSKFAPTLLSGTPIKVTGVIIYNFQEGRDGQVSFGEVTPTPGETPESPLTAEMLAESARIALEAKHRRMMSDKLHFWIFAALERQQKGEAAPAPNEDRFIRERRAGIEIVFSARSPETIEKLKALGMQVTLIKGALRAEGFIPVEKLEELAGMDEVKVILPKMM